MLWLYDGTWLTLRTRHPTAGRRWICPGPVVHPVGVLLEDTGGLPLAAGGAVRPDHTAELDTWVGPPGWLPDLPISALVGLRLQGGRLHVAPVTLSSAAVGGHTALVRDAVQRHLASAARHVPIRGEWDRTWGHSPRGPLDQLRHAVRSAGIDEPDIFAEPTPPLEEVLQVPYALDTLWADIPDPWVRHAQELRRELEWMEAHDESLRTRLEVETGLLGERLLARRTEEGHALDRRFGDADEDQSVHGPADGVVRSLFGQPGAPRGR